MPRVKLTDRTVVAKKVTVAGKPTIHLPPSEGVVELWDSIVPGLALRVGYGGKRTYTVTTRINGDQVRRRVGTTDTHKLSEARDAARDILRDAAKGIDSHSKQAKKRNALREQQEAAKADGQTFRAVAEAWLTDSRKRGGANLRSKQRIERRLERRVFSKLGALPIAEITRADVSALVGNIAHKHPIAANRTLADMRRVFNWAVRNDRLAASPAMGVEPPGEAKSRERVLSDAEIERLWRGFDELGSPQGSIFKLLLLTGARRNEVGGMRWAELENGNWILPSVRAKNKREHLWPLSAMAKALLDSTPRVDGSAFVFPAQFKGRDPETGERTVDRPVSSWGWIKWQLDKTVAETAAKEAGEPLDMGKHGLAPWTIHDLRRTVVTGMNEALGIEPHIIEAVVGHVSGSAKSGVAGVYNRASYLPQRKNALERWAEHIKEIASGRPRKTGNVERLKPRKRSA